MSKYFIIKKSHVGNTSYSDYCKSCNLDSVCHETTNMSFFQIKDTVFVLLQLLILTIEIIWITIKIQI